MAYGFNPLFLVFLLGALAVSGVAYLALVWVIAWATTTVADRLPPDEHKGMGRSAWLLLVPVFNLLWAFVLVSSVTGRLQQLLHQRGESVHLAGRGVGSTFAYCHLASGLLLGFAIFASIVLFIGANDDANKGVGIFFNPAFLMIYIYGFIPVFTGLVLVMNVFGYRFARVLRTSVAGLAVPAVQGGTPPIQPPVAPPSASPPTA